VKNLIIFVRIVDDNDRFAYFGTRYRSVADQVKFCAEIALHYKISTWGPVLFSRNLSITVNFKNSKVFLGSIIFFAIPVPVFTVVERYGEV
jgi:hypothetical protein